MSEQRVLMVGTDISTPGGIASVIIDYQDFGLMDRLGIDYIPTHCEGSKLNKMVFFAKNLLRILARLRRFDILHAHPAYGWSFRRLSLLVLLAKVFRKRAILHVHGSQFDLYYERSSATEQRFIRYIFRLTDVIVALSNDWERKFREIEPGANIVVVRNGVDHRKYRCNRERGLVAPFCVLTLGKLGDRKGSYVMLKAIEKLQGKPFHFILAGDGEVEQVKSQVARLPEPSQVEVPGWVGPGEKKRLLSEADIYVLPSFNEGLPISILEAMSAGLPVVSTPVGGIPEAVIEGKTGYLVAPGDADALAAAIERSVSDARSWQAMSAAGLRHVEDGFTMDRVESALSAIYSSLRRHNIGAPVAQRNR